MLKVVYYLVLVTYIGNNEYMAQEVDSYWFKPRCELAIKARNMLIDNKQAYVCIMKEIKDVN